jgi:hypothetical protein
MREKQVAATLVLCGLLIQLLILAVGCTANAESPGQIELSATEFDFGAVPNDKPVSQVFQVRNAGRGPLEILGLSTSCGCTTAEIDDHRLAPGATTNLTVTYDPQAHDGATDEFMRIVYVRSDDPATAEATLTLRVKVVDPYKESN